MNSTMLLSAVLLPLTEKAGDVAQVQDLLSMLEQCFIDAFKMSLPADASAGTSLSHEAPPAPPSAAAAPIDAGEEAKLMAVRAVTNFHRSGAARHRAFFQQPTYHPHAALFIHELLKSLSGNSQQWFRQLQLDSLEACLAIMEVIGVDNVRLCVPGVVSVGVRYVHRSHHGKDSSKVCLTALRLLRAALTLSFSVAEPATWVRDTVAHLTNALRTILDPAALVGGAYGLPVVCALESLCTSLLLSPAMSDHLSTPLGALLIVAYAVVTNLAHLHRLDDSVQITQSRSETPARGDSSVAQTHRLDAILRSTFAVAAVRDALQYLRGVELLHVATSAARLSVWRDAFFPVQSAMCATECAVSGESAVQAAGESSPGDSVVAIFLSVVRKCVRLVGTEMNDAALYTHQRPRKYPAGVVDGFLFALSGAIARLPGAVADGAGDSAAEETTGEQLTNALLEEYGAILQDWDAYALHPPVLYVLTRLVVWQFHPSHQASGSAAGSSSSGGGGGGGVVYPCPSDLVMSGAFEQLWSVVAPAHLWDITHDEDLCNNQQIHHRQVVAATLLRALALSAEVLAGQRGAAGGHEDGEALERLYALTLYLVLEKATASGIVHVAAMHCVEVFSAASAETDAVAFLLRHSSLIVDETARAVRVAHLRPAAASVLRGSLAFLESHLTGDGTAAAEAMDGEPSGGDAAPRPRFAGSSTQLTAVVRQRLSMADMTTLFEGGRQRLASLEAVAQVADFVASAVHVAQEALYLCSRYDSDHTAEDLAGRRAALALLRDALDVAAYLNFCVPQEALDEDQERRTTAAHTRVRALQTVTLEAIYTVLQYCTTHNTAAPLAVQTVVRGLTSFLTASTAVTWAERARQRQHEAEAARRQAKRDTLVAERHGKRFMERTSDVSGDDGSTGAESEAAEETRESLPVAPPLDWPWTHYVSTALSAQAGEPVESGGPRATVELPRSHLHTVYRVYLSLFALLREPVALFTTVAAGPGARSGTERRKLGEVPVTPAIFETLSGIESLRILACDFLLHRMVEEVLPLVLLWHERGCTPRIPTHTEERLKTSTQQFVARLSEDCKESVELLESVAQRCRGYPLLAAVVARVASRVAPSAKASGEAVPALLVPQNGGSV